ncbi:MAG TPA: hypothetical protein DIW07_09040 [Lachnospiraceae bacterium]|nr:hypothetical protein [Lachnospiraceae bacterium]
MSNLQFSKDLEHGRIGEKWYYDYCIDKGIICIPVKDDEFIGYEGGIDFLVQYQDLSIWKVDVKFCSRIHQTGNMFIEMYQDTGKIGWYYKSKCNAYCYIDEYNGILWIYTKAALQEYIDTHKTSLRNTTNKIDGCYVTGTLVNVNNFAAWCKNNNHNLVKYVRMLDIEDIDEVL